VARSFHRCCSSFVSNSSTGTTTSVLLFTIPAATTDVAAATTADALIPPDVGTAGKFRFSIKAVVCARDGKGAIGDVPCLGVSDRRRRFRTMPQQ